MNARAMAPEVDAASCTARGARPCERFDLETFRGSAAHPAGFFRLLEYPLHAWALGLLRCAFPIVRVPRKNLYLITRYDDVREVLANDRAFPVPWTEKMKGLTDDENFVLGMPRDAKYELSYKQLAEAFRREDIPAIKEMAAAASVAALARSTILDVVQELMWAIPTQLCEDYYGIDIPDKVAFAYWTVAVSGYVFGPPDADNGSHQARAAAGCLRRVIDASIERARCDPTGDTVVRRLAAIVSRDYNAGPGETKDDTRKRQDHIIRAQLFGMVLGFIPTNLIAGGNMLDMLLRFDKHMEPARAAARRDDDEQLWHCLQESLRFRFINPGTWRVCGSEPYTIAAGTPRERTIPAGALVLASVQSAMFDGLRIPHPGDYDPSRRPDNYMTFGHGQHWCIGAFIAKAQITETFKALLKKKDLNAVPGAEGRMRRISIYPAHLTVSFSR